MENGVEVGFVQALKQESNLIRGCQGEVGHGDHRLEARVSMRNKVAGSASTIWGEQLGVSEQERWIVVGVRESGRACE